MQRKTNNSGIILKQLEKELACLQNLFKTGYDLSVKWQPKSKTFQSSEGSFAIDGEIRDNAIYIYSDQLDSAIQTLKHEFIEYILDKLTKPYRDLTNILIQFLNRKEYKEREILVDTIAKCL